MGERAPRVPVEIGTVLDGRYELESVLGAGGMGIVYRARHLALRQPVAIKMPLTGVMTDTDTVQRLLREARAAVRLRSAHVCRVLDVGSTPEGLPYLVLEHLDGLSLSAYLHRKGTLPFDQIWRFLLEVCDAVGEAHRAGIVHRDLKPQNFFLVADRHGRRSIKVLDFGISKVTDLEGSDLQLTHTSALLGSPSYIAPEQMTETRSVDARADVWSLGVCAYELVTGILPFKGASVMDLAVRIANDTVTPPSKHRPDLPPALESIILRCLEKRRVDRFDSAVALAEALVDAAPEAVARAFAAAEPEGGALPSLTTRAASEHAPDDDAERVTATEGGDTRVGLSTTEADPPSFAPPVPTVVEGRREPPSASPPSAPPPAPARAPAPPSPEPAAPARRGWLVVLLGLVVLAGVVAVNARGRSPSVAVAPPPTPSVIAEAPPAETAAAPPASVASSASPPPSASTGRRVGIGPKPRVLPRPSSTGTVGRPPPTSTSDDDKMPSTR